MDDFSNTVKRLQMLSSRLRPTPGTSLIDAEAPERAAAALELVDYVTQEQLHNRLTPRIVDIAYSAFMAAKKPNAEDGGPSDWFTDTKPMVDEAIAKIRAELLSILQPKEGA